MRRRILLALMATASVAALVGGVEACGYWVSTRGAGVVTNGVAADFSLQDQNGATVTLGGLLAHGPAVLVFYRGHW